ncbi:hypothetical protein BW21_1273 [Burkholderia humptydooensis]|nr:hypothetical protein BW21_1273 [Burkholderia sp. 2002721687]
MKYMVATADKACTADEETLLTTANAATELG